jgi:hypothetical protein
VPIDSAITLRGARDHLILARSYQRSSTAQIRCSTRVKDSRVTLPVPFAIGNTGAPSNALQDLGGAQISTPQADPSR